MTQEFCRKLPKDVLGAHRLTDREALILTLLAKGHTNGEMAEVLNLSVLTVKNYVQGVLSKLGAHTRLRAVALAVEYNLISHR